MANKFYEENDISAIASAIRTKLGSQDTFKVNEMADAVASIPTGQQPTGTIQITQNGTGINVAQYATADVAVQPNVGTKTITENGTYNASSDNLDGYSQVSVNVQSLPSDLEIIRTTLTSTSKTFTIQSDTTRSIAFCFIIPVTIAGSSDYHASFLLGKSNFVTGDLLSQWVGSYFNYNTTSESFNITNACSMSIDANGLITVSTRSDGNYTFREGDVFDVYLIYFDQAQGE